MAHHEPPHQDLHCLQIQLFSSLVVKELNRVVPNVFTSKDILFTDMNIDISSEVDIKLLGDKSTPYISGYASFPDG